VPQQPSLFRLKRLAAWMGALLVVPLSIGIGHAEPLPKPADPRVLGDWALRDRLFEQGLDFQLGYVTETATNLSGGTRSVVDYTHQVTVGATFDLERLVGLHDAVIQVTYTERAGRNLVDDAQLGTLQLVQEVWGRGQTVRLTELSFEQKYFSQLVSWKWGRLPVGGDFAVFPCDFQNLTFCGSQPGNIAGGYIFNWPISQRGTRVKVNLADFGYYQLGIYDQNDQYLGFTDKLLPVWYAGSSGVLLPVELAWLPRFAGGTLAGSYKIGAWYSSASANDAVLDVNGDLAALTGVSPLRRQGLYGGYLSFQQQITRTSSDNPNGGLKLFLNAVFADPATSTIEQQIAIGAWYTGPFSFRPNDVIAFAAGTTRLNSRVTDVGALQNALGTGPGPVKTAEYVFELDYTFVPTPGFLVRPNVQYILSSGGSSINKEIWVLGLKTVITF
jgi:porin